MNSIGRRINFVEVVKKGISSDTSFCSSSTSRFIQEFSLSVRKERFHQTIQFFPSRNSGFSQTVNDIFSQVEKVDSVRQGIKFFSSRANRFSQTVNNFLSSRKVEKVDSVRQ